MSTLNELPVNLPVPVDDGAADHLVGEPVPHLRLRSTSGETIDIGELSDGRTILYCYPMTGRPGVAQPPGWDEIPGARGCTTEACDFRDHYQELLRAGAGAVFGVSSQESTYQREAVERLHLPFAMLSDEALEIAESLRLPTFVAGGRRLFTRLTLIIRDGQVEHAFYPVFPPNEHGAEVLAWLRQHQL